MSNFIGFLTFIAVMAVVFFLMDLFCKFLVRMIVLKMLPNKIKKMDDNKLKRMYRDAERFSGTLGYIIGFFFTGLFIFSFMRIPKAQFKCYEEEMIRRGLSL